MIGYSIVHCISVSCILIYFFICNLAFLFMARFIYDTSSSSTSKFGIKRTQPQENCISPKYTKARSSCDSRIPQSYIDTEDLTFQSSPSPDASEVEIVQDSFVYKNSNTQNLPAQISYSYTTMDHSNPDPVYSQKVAHMMRKMGYKVSKGLGAEEQGNTNPLEYSKHSGRTGIGYPRIHLSDTLKSDNCIIEIASSFAIKWLSSQNTDQPFPILSFITESKTLNVVSQAKFIDSTLLSNLLSNKNKLESYENRDDFLFARKRSNPFERIGKAIFQNRAAMKMANIDAMLDYKLTSWTKGYSPTEFLDDSNDISPFYFADLCAGPGGFSEYILFRLGWRAKGFGFTLRGDCDFRLSDFIAGTPETFEPHYGFYGDGDITRKENLLSFQKYVFEVSNKSGVSLVMGDGGFDVKGQENFQELLSKQLILCQFLCATSILHEGGNFICKTFDLFTIFSVNLIYLMYRCFNRIAIIKPCTSRPANSERYLVCNDFKLREGKKVFNLLLEVNDKFNIVRDIGEDILDFLPINVIGAEFVYRYIIRSNNLLAGFQNESLLRLLTNIIQKENTSDFHIPMKTLCYLAWHIPEIPRSNCKIMLSNPNVYFEEFCRISNFSPQILLTFSNYDNLLPSNIDAISEIYSWHCYPLYGRRLILVSLGRDNIYYWDVVNEPYRFAHISTLIDQSLEIPAQTIIEVMLVETFSEDEKKLLKKQVWIIDIYAISNQIVCNWSRSRRSKIVKQLYQVTHKPLSNYIPMRPILSFNLNEVPKLLKNTMNCQQTFEVEKKPYLRLKENSCVQMDGLLFTRIIKHPWIARMSKTHNKLYYFNTKTNSSSFEFPREAIMDGHSGLKSRVIWKWEIPQVILPNNDLDVTLNSTNSSFINFSYLTHYVSKRL